MTICNVDTSTPGTIKLTTASGKPVVLLYDASAWSIKVEKPSTDGPEYSSFATKWAGHSINRIVVTAISPRSKAKIAYTIKAA